MSILPRSQSRLLITVLFAASLILATVPTTPTRAEDRIGVSSTLEAQNQAQTNYGKLPLRFEPNVGQRDLPDTVKYFSRAGAMSLFLTDSSAVFALNRPQARLVDPQDKNYLAAKMHQPVDESTSAYQDSLPAGVAIYMRWLGGLPAAEVGIEGSDKQPGITNYFIGNDPAKWRTNIAGFGKATYREVYPGIGLAFYGNNNQIEYDFIVEPLADPTQIRLSFEGADSLRLNEQGDLIIGTPLGELKQSLPQIYQQQGTAKNSIAGHYLLRQAEGATLPEVGFEVESYDPTLPLVIDPLIYSTFLGGSGDEIGYGIAVDGTGSAYVAGITTSIDFPPTIGAYDFDFNGVIDAFVTKLNAEGSDLNYSTFLGGSSYDLISSIALDSSGNTYLTGTTSSTNFPTLNAYDSTYNGGGIFGDVFITKLNSGGNTLAYSTYLGGSGGSGGTDNDIAAAIKIDSSGNVYITGSTQSTNFPTTDEAYNTNKNSGEDIFITKLEADGSGLVYSTFVGGNGNEYGTALELDTSGNVYVAGSTSSTNFPTSVGAYNTSYNGGTGSYGDVVLVKLQADGSKLLYSTYLGGTGGDEAKAMALDSSGNVYLAGTTSSTDFPFPPIGGSYDTTQNGSTDVFITCLKANGTELLYSTYLGGTGSDEARSMVLDPFGNIFLTGTTTSSDFPTTASAYDTDFNASSDVFIIRLNPAGDALLYSTYLGGNGAEMPLGLVINDSGYAYLTGYTTSNNFPTTAGAYDTSFTGGSVFGDVFVAKLRIVDCLQVVMVEDVNYCGTLRKAIEVASEKSATEAAVIQLTAGSNYLVNSELPTSQSLGLPISILGVAGNPVTIKPGTGQSVAVGLRLGTGVTVKDLKLQGFTGDGIVVEGKNNRIENVEVLVTSGRGLVVSAGGNVVIKGLRITRLSF